MGRRIKGAIVGGSVDEGRHVAWQRGVRGSRAVSEGDGSVDEGVIKG
jgi:hypothetical protein